MQALSLFLKMSDSKRMFHNYIPLTILMDCANSAKSRVGHEMLVGCELANFTSYNIVGIFQHRTGAVIWEIVPLKTSFERGLILVAMAML